MIVKTLEEKPADVTDWSTRSLAHRTGLSQSSVSRIWHAFGLQPHRAESFRLSTDRLLIDKVRDAVGLHLDPPERAVVLCVDEKSQIQALARFQRILPMLTGTPERRSHDYVRHGVTSLFAGLDTLTGKVIGALHRRHRAPRVPLVPGAHRCGDGGHQALAAAPPTLHAPLHPDRR